MVSTPDLATVDAARRDPAVFAEVLVGQGLWPHQAEVARSAARYRVVTAGRQVGKSRLLAVLALHQAFAVGGSTVLLVSAGDVASKRLLQEVSSLALSAPLLAGAVVDESSSAVRLTNGSQVLSVPASQRQIRGWAVDLLVLDEAGFIDPEIWRAAEPAIIARPGARVLLCSSPWGGVDHFFRVLWRRGMDAPDGMYAGWHWPSAVSPLVDGALLAEIAEREPADYFRREYLAQWTDDRGSYFSEVELTAAASDYELVDPVEDPDGARAVGMVSGGVDWGFSRDANTLAVVAARPGADDRGRRRFWVCWLEEHYQLEYDAWLERLFHLSASYSFVHLVCETNGVGQMPAQMLARRFAVSGARLSVVVPVATTAALKEDVFGFIKILLQQGRLDLPREPALLKLGFPSNRGGSFIVDGAAGGWQGFGSCR